MKDEEEPLAVVYKGFRLEYWKDDLWQVMEGPPHIRFGKLSEIKWKLDQWEIEKAEAASLKVWLIYDTLQVRLKPDDWRLYTATFRALRKSSEFGEIEERVKISWKNDDDYRWLQDYGRTDIAVDTPEVQEAIKKARTAYAAAVRARKKWEAAYNAIPRMSKEQWAALPQLGKPPLDPSAEH